MIWFLYTVPRFSWAVRSLSIRTVARCVKKANIRVSVSSLELYGTFYIAFTIRYFCYDIARRVRVDSFLFDAHTVTALDFARFVVSTSYLTDAERHGWSFLLDSQLDEAQVNEVSSSHGPLTPCIR